jgi:DNA-binding transcriptional regulator YiaG
MSRKPCDVSFTKGSTGGELTMAETMKAMRQMTGLTQAEFAAHRA